MKRVTASDARKNWFRILDEVADGEVVCIERGGRRILIAREPEGATGAIPDYSGILQASRAAEADRWSWAWTGDDGYLEPKDTEGEE